MDLVVVSPSPVFNNGELSMWLVRYRVASVDRIQQRVFHGAVSLDELWNTLSFGVDLMEVTISWIPGEVER